MSHVILSAFEPFGNDDMNSSRIVIDMIKGKCGANEIRKIILPVVYEKAFNILSEHIYDLAPEYVICLGQAGGRSKISVERIAVNINNSNTPDNEGSLRKDLVIDDSGQMAYMTDIPVVEMKNMCPDTAVTSYSAGTFVCNDIFYRLMHNRRKGIIESKIGFIHLPYTEHFGKIPLIESRIQARSVEAMLSVLGE
jgi:pyroglutamyl-peptidase